MDGGFGDHVYIVNDAGDVAAEVASGIDTVRGLVSHTWSGEGEAEVIVDGAEDDVGVAAVAPLARAALRCGRGSADITIIA
jgi:hypothetical protein